MMMMMMRWLVWFQLVTMVTSAGRSRVRLNNQSSSRSIQLMNQSGVKVDFFWVNSATGELAGSTTAGGEGIAVGGDAASNSFVGHTFEIQEMPNKITKRCRQTKCQTTRFTVTANEDQIFTLHKNFTVTIEDHKTRAQGKAKKALNACQVTGDSSSSLSPEEKMDAMIACMERQIDETISETQQEIQFQASIRKDMGHALTEYICNDVNATTTKAILNHTWTFTNPSDPKGKKEQKHVRILFEAEMSKILLVEDFASPQECQAIRDNSKLIPRDSSSNEDNTDNEDIMVLPLSAKTQSMDVVKVLLKVQSLIDTMLGRKVSFGDKDPLFEIHRFHSSVAKEDETCTTTTTDESPGSCTADTGAAVTRMNRNIHWIYDNEEEEEEEEVIFATLMVICQAHRGAIHFPKTGVHVAATNATVGHAVLVVHRDAETLKQDKDPYLDVFAICTPTSRSSKDGNEEIPKEDAGMTLLVDRFAG